MIEKIILVLMVATLLGAMLLLGLLIYFFIYVRSY